MGQPQLCVLWKPAGWSVSVSYDDEGGDALPIRKSGDDTSQRMQDLSNPAWKLLSASYSPQAATPTRQSQRDRHLLTQYTDADAEHRGLRRRN